MERNRSFICLRCGKQYCVSWDIYQQIKKDPICDICKKAAEIEIEGQIPPESMQQSIETIFSKLNEAVKRSKNSKKHTQKRDENCDAD